jgi:hypothetical protein
MGSHEDESASLLPFHFARNGKTIAKLTNPYQDRVAIAESLFGCIPDTMTPEEAQEERLLCLIR